MRKAPRGVDVSPALRWFPVVTMSQLLADMALATTSPIGYGHIYAHTEADAERLRVPLRGRY